MDLPTILFLTDLAQATTKWQAEGDIIILSINLNEDIRDLKIQTMLRSVGLIEVTMVLHTQKPPATHNQGSLPINSIFVPVTLLKQCWMRDLAFGNAVPSDHQAVWLNIPAQCMCLVKLEPIARPLAHCLQCKDPRVVTKYNQTLWELLSSSSMVGWAQVLASKAKSRLSQTQQSKYKAINKVAMEYRHHVGRNTRKSMLEQYSSAPKCPKLSTIFCIGRAYGAK